jgi:transcriptional regulator with XRE-family HTH domain
VGTGSKRGQLSLRELRHQRGLSLEAVALLAGLDVSQVSRLERGLCKPRPTTVVKLGRALGIRVPTLLEIFANSAPAEATDEPEPAGDAA